MKKHSNDIDQTNTHDAPQDPGRRKFLNHTAAIAGLAGAGLTVGIAGCKVQAGCSSTGHH